MSCATRSSTRSFPWPRSSPPEVRLAATFAVWLVVAGCGAPVLTEADYSDLVAKRSAAYAAEAEELRSSHLFQLEQVVNDLVRDLDPDVLEGAVVSELSLIHI